jgi:hypothetical protein
MDKVEQLYNLYLQKGLITSATTLDMFRTANEQQQSSLYSLGKKNSLFSTTDLGTFQSAWNGQQAAPQPQEEFKKKEESVTMVSPSGASSLASRQPDTFDFSGIAKPQTENEKLGIKEVKDIDFAKMAKDKAEREAATPEAYKSSLDIITPDLINSTEEFVVPKMNYQFGPIGFKFEETGVTGDYMIGTAPNGEKMEFSLDPFFGAESEAKKLRKFIDDNTDTTVTGLKSIEKQYAQQTKRIANDEQRDAELKAFDDNATALKNDITMFLSEKKKIDDEESSLNSVPILNRNTPEYKQRVADYSQKKAALEAKAQGLLSREEQIKMNGKNLESVIGQYTAMKAEQGSWAGGLLDSFMTGIGGMAAGQVNAYIDAFISEYGPLGADKDVEKTLTDEKATGVPSEDAIKLKNLAVSNAYRINEDYNEAVAESKKRGDKFLVLPMGTPDPIPMPKAGQTVRDWYNSLTDEQQDSVRAKSNDDLRKEFKKNLLPSIRTGAEIVLGDPSTTVEWAELKKQGFWGGAILGVAESLPAMVGSNTNIGWAQRTAQMYSQVSDTVYEEMSNNPEFDKISENEKLAVVAPIGIASAVLESLGLRNVIANKGMMNRIILGAMGKAGATTTAKTFGELVKNEVNSMVGRGLLTVTGAALAEAETGAAQQVSEYALKEMYNEIKGKEMFQTPDFLSAEYIKDVATAGAQEAVGGFVLGVPSAVSAAYSKKGFLSMDDKAFEFFRKAANDSEIERAYVIKLKQEASTGNMTMKEAKEALNDYRNSVGLYRSVPEGLSTQDAKEAMNLLKEKKDLEQQIQGKDEALVRRQKSRIGDINNELDAISNRTAAEPAAEPATGAPGNRVQVLTDEEERRRLNLESFVTGAIKRTPEGAQPSASLVIGSETITFEDAQSELNALNEKARSAAATETAAARPSLLSSPETVTAALEQLPTEERTAITFEQEDGTETSVMGNEKMLAELYDTASQLSEQDRTPQQQSVIDAVEVSLKTQIDEELSQTQEQAQEQAQQQTPRQGRVFGTVNGNVVEMSDSFFEGLNDNETYEFMVDSIDQVPPFFREFVEEVQSDKRKKILGLPIGKKEGGKLFKMSMYGDTAKAFKNEIISSKANKMGTTKAEIFANTVRSLATIFPDLKTKNLKSLQEMKDYATQRFGASFSSQILGGEGGMIIYDLNNKPIEILINDSVSDATTLPHEAWHAILIKAFGDNQALFSEFRDNVRQSLIDNGFNEIAKQLDEFSESETYKQSNVQAEEWLVQLGGLLTAAGITSENLTPKAKTLLDEIKSLFNGIAVKITGQPMFLEDARPEDVLEFMVTISERMSKGQDISMFFRDVEQQQTEQGPRVKAKRQIVGENAQLAQDIRGNLQIARDMEIAGKDAKTIRLATGWENGADGKWRYETTDNIPFLKDTVRQVAKFINENQIEDNIYQKANYFLPSELLSLYPQLNEVTIQFNKNGNEQEGDYNPKTKTISVNLGVYPQNTVSILLHEIQHVIQDIEGFEQGGNVKEMSTSDEALQKLASPLTFPKLSKEDRQAAKEKTKAAGLPFSESFYFDVIKDDLETIEDAIDRLEILNKVSPNEAYVKLIDALDFKVSEMNGVNKAFENYKRLAGEVEARNVQTRMNMTPEQKRNATLEETEDVARENQIMTSEEQRGLRVSRQAPQGGGTLQEVATEGPSLFRTEGDANIGFQYDTDKVARERFNIPKLNKIGSGSDRVVFDIGNGRVLKVAKTARGLEQNIYEGDAYLTVVPKIFERGLNYVVVEKADRLKASDMVPTYDENGDQVGEARASEMIKDLQKFGQKDLDSAGSKLQDVLMKYGLEDVMSYNVLWGDFSAIRNWGYKDGMPLHVDGGTFGGVDMLKSRSSKNLTDPEFREIYDKSRKAKKEFGDTDVYAKFQRVGDTDIQQIQKIAQRYNVNNQGFAPKQVNESALRNELKRFGYSAKRAKSDGQGRGGGVFIVDGNGRFFNPFKAKFSRINLGAGSLQENVDTIPGYARMLEVANGIIEKSIKRGLDKAKTMDNVMKYVTKSKVYEIANDSQREQLVRNVETEFGKRQKSAPSVKRDLFMGEGRLIIADLEDVKKITMTERELLKKQIRDLARGAKDAKVAWMRASNELTKTIKKMATSKKITLKQAANILRRFSKVNVFNQDSIDKFVDYMVNVFQDAEYADKINRATKLLPTAKKNLRTKVGMANELVPSLQRLFAINPALLPMSVFEKYMSIVDSFGQKSAILTLPEIQETTKSVNDILSAIDEEVSMAEEMAERFDYYDEKVYDDEGKLLYAETITQMLEKELITAKEAEVMRKYKSIILPRAVKPKMTEQEIQDEKDRIIRGIMQMPIQPQTLPTKDEIDLAERLKKLLVPSLLKNLSIAQLNNIAKLIDNINNGYLPHYAQLMTERLNAFKNAIELEESVKNAKPLSFTKIYARLKSKFTGKDPALEMIRRSPLTFVDQVFGDFKTKTIFNTVFNGIAEGQSLFDSSINKINKRLDAAHEAVAKSFRYNSNKTLLSSFKMMTYMLQLEYESNPGSKQVNPASKYLKTTINHIEEGNSRYGDKDAEMLQSILDEYGEVVGQNESGKDIIEINKDKLYNSFNEAEKAAIKEIQDLNKSLTEKASYTAAIIRGQRIDPLVNYIHLPVLHDYNPDEQATATQSANEYNEGMRPSTKARNLIARTGTVSPINFDVFASAQRGAKFTLLDYYLTEPIRTARKTVSEAKIKLQENEATKERRKVLNVISNSLDEVVANVLTSNMVADSFADEVVNFISKQGYRAILASIPRFIAELSSNIGFVLIVDRKSFAKGTKYRSMIMSPLAIAVMENTKSKQTSRLFHGDTLSGKFIDRSILTQSSGLKSATAKGTVENTANMIYNMSLKKYKNAVELTADALISTPDKMVMRPLWFGVFASEFKKQTGEEVDFDKIGQNNEAYMKKNADAIEFAKKAADERTVLAGATDNPFMGILKGTVKPNQSVMLRAFNNFNNFMTRFAIYEYSAARQGIYAAMGNGTISRRQGVALLAAVTTRMTTYTLLSSILSSTMLSMFADEDEDDEKTFMQKLGQSLTSTMTGLILGRDFGNATKSMVNFGVEEMNEKFLTGLRNGDYDPYKDAISYSIMPKEKKGQKTNLTDFITQMGGSFGPALKTLDLTARKVFEAPKKEAAAIERGKQESQVRVPLEILGNLGMVPLYKDIRKIVMSSMYKDLENADKKAADKKQAEKEMLQGYENKTEMKRYDPELYEETFGEKSPGYDEQQAKKEIKKQKDELEQKMKDEFYNYVPSKKDKPSFGSKKFGAPKETKKKTTKGFGSKKFGE